MNELPVVHKFGGSCLRDASDLEHIAEIITKADHPVVRRLRPLGHHRPFDACRTRTRYAGRLVNDLASHHLRFSPTLIESPLYEIFQRVLDGIEESLTALATDRDDRQAYNQLLASGERLSALVIAHALSIRGIDATRLVERTSACNSTVKEQPPKLTSQVLEETRPRRVSRRACRHWLVWRRNRREHRPAWAGRKRPHGYRFGCALASPRRRVVEGRSWHLSSEPTLGRTIAPIPYLGYGEAIEFSNADATILHPATVEPVYEMGIPIEIRHLSRYKENGLKTVIGPDVETEPNIKGIACIPPWPA